MASCTQRSERDSLSVQIKILANESRSLADTVQQFEIEQHRLSSLTDNLQRQLASTTGTHGELDELLSAYQAACRGRELFDRLTAKLTELEERSRLLLGGKSRTEIEELVERRSIRPR